MSKLTRQMLDARRAQAKAAMTAQNRTVLICAGTGCIAGGSLKIYEYLKEECTRRGIAVQVSLLEDESQCAGHAINMKKSGCHGFCEMGPLLQIEPEGYLYTHVTLDDCNEIIEKTILGGEVIERLLYTLDGVSYARHDEIPFYHRQHRVVLANCGTTDAEDLDEYIARDGYAALEKALFTMTDEDICREISDSGLRGRGGGGFPAGQKWNSVRRQPKGKKYVVCNGDEGDPGAFMDRSIMEGNPHSIIEGMLIAALAAGSDEGYIYVRAEYPLAVERLRTAIAKAEQYGLLGEDILGSGFSFHLHINRGAGAFVCGEGSALTASIEGNRGMPRVKPPRTVEQGLWARPTVLNNVETFSAVPLIIRNGAHWFRTIGTEKSPGTKAFALTGNVVNTGLIEVPMGTTLREVIFDIGGGIKDGKAFKAVQIGGPSGGCLTAEHLDMPLDFDSLKKLGAIIGSGGLVVMDEDTCMVEVARFFMSFTQNESCGKCVPCREGTKRMLEILERIVKNEGTEDDLYLLEELASTITETALCGLGKSACNPVVSTLKYFRNEYLAHVVDKHCPHCNGRKKKVVIDPALCRGCGKCKRTCPMEAISGEIRQPHVIDNDKCITCGGCWGACPFGAINAIEEG
ncbi:MAG: NADH-quinone oxidoreductase subunit NuoF [Oscillospiraceae bacterium]|nr:NADH-quinone oxidoreductase subunit NuoF [Oscillospiraceae bacterium]